MSAAPKLKHPLAKALRKAALAFPDPLPQGVEVERLEVRGDFARVRLANGRDVWVRGSSVTPIDD